MKILITGAAGFIGSHVTERLLERGDEVIGLDDFNDYYAPTIKRANLTRARSMKGFTLIEGDIRDDKLVHQLLRNNHFDSILHLAARAGVRPSIADPILYDSANIAGFLNLLEAAVKYDKPYMVYASSSSVYGLSPRLPWREDDPVDCPISPYAVTKRAGELLCGSYHDTYGLKTCGLRFFTVYGPRQRPEMAIAKFFAAILRGEPITVYGDGSARRDFTFVSDIVTGVVNSIDGGFEKEIINLGGSATVTLLELIDLIAETCGKKPILRFEDAKAGDVPSTWADCSKATALLGEAPQTTLTEGLKRYYSWLKEGAERF